MTAPPCLNCPDRRAGCHDPAVCPKWADYENIHKAELAARPSYREREDMVEYIKDRRRRYMPGRWKKETNHAESYRTDGPSDPRPELRHTGNGTAVASFSLAVDRDYKGQSGEKETDFVDIVAWRSTADFVSKFFTKGRMAVVEGRLQLRDWKDKDGNNRRSAEVVAEHVYFGDSKRSESDTPPASGDFREIPEDEEGELPF